MIRINPIALACTAAIALSACSDVLVETVHYDARIAATGMDIHTRPGASGAPAVLLVHGGSWVHGDRFEMTRAADRLAELGYVAATIDYRLVPDGRFPSAVDDVWCALSYLRAHAAELDLDPERIATVGYSAGAHLVGLVAVAGDSAELQETGCPTGRTGPPAAAVSIAGPMDLSTLQGDVVADFVGAAYSFDPERWVRASPISYVGANEPPFLFVHAEHDLIVPVEQSERMYAALREAGNTASLLRLEGGGHAVSEGVGLGHEHFEFAFETPESWMALVDFLANTVGEP